MTVQLNELLVYCDNLLTPGRFRDYCPNGLQVEGRTEVGRIVTGVTACQALLDAAVDWQADAVLVHHGYFWKGEDSAVRGIKRNRLKTLLANDISLIGYHLPLDCHPTLGNNARLAELLELETTGGLEPGNPDSVGLVGKLAQPLTATAFAERIARALGRQPLLIEGGDHLIETVGWCTGAAQGYIEQAIAQSMDAFISGEISEPTVHSARENGIHYFAAGHHATERYGVQALGEALAAEFGIEHRFIDIDNPV
ncbi:Nif3-like dinuclear metal center hexameric protein [Marinobacterium arenosum]|uniref:Nif3-like dinuclear metal center hexameric protein n=1 Tax=Marinobacterium arenosum TaxID=2862496 RepID=UPI0036F2B9F2